MSHHPIDRFRSDMAQEEQAAFDRWLRVNAVIASVFAAAILAMAVANIGAPAPSQATASLQTTSTSGSQTGE